MRSWISLGVLVALVAGLGVFIYTKPTAEQRGTHTLTSVKPQDVKRLRVQWLAPDGTNSSNATSSEGSEAASTTARSLTLERSGPEWRITAPFAARADAFQVQRVLGIADARSEARYPATDLARFGLDRPAITLTLDDSQIDFGAVNATTREQYVRAGDFVYAVPISGRTSVPRGPDAFLSRELFARDELPIRFELPGFVVALEDNTWKVVPDTSQSTPDERNAWVDGWRRATALSASRADGPGNAKRIAIRLKDGRVLALGVERDESGFLLTRDDEHVRYRFTADAFARLIEPPGARRVKE
jgi:hypothetical protein